jgi:hypothetical protein
VTHAADSATGTGGGRREPPRAAARGDRLIVDRPSPAKDKPNYATLGAAFALLLGIGWALPRAACGNRGGEQAPEEGAGAAGSASVVEPSPSGEPSGSPSASTSGAPSGSAPTAPETPDVATVTVGKSTLAHCQDPPAAELKPSKCGDHAFDGTAVAKLQQLSTCPAAAGVTGKLSIGVDVNFKAATLKITAAKSSVVQRGGRRDDKAIEPLLACVRASLKDLPSAAADNGATRDHARYVVYYPVTITAPTGAAGTPAPSSSVAGEKATTGTATVQVDTAIVRDAPHMTGAPIGRLSRGTKVTTVGLVGHWYHVKFGDNDAQDGWVFRTNIGK